MDDMSHSEAERKVIHGLPQEVLPPDFQGEPLLS